MDFAAKVRIQLPSISFEKSIAITLNLKRNYTLLFLKNNLLQTLFFCVFLLMVLSLELKGQAVQFSNLSLKDGLSQNSITDIIQDRNGFVWVGTYDGLNRYDGNEFLIIRGEKGAEEKLSGNTVTALFEDSDGYIWVGTNFGLNRLNPRTFEIASYSHWFRDSLSLSNNSIRCIAEDKDGHLWVGTRNGLNKMLRDSTFQKFKIDEEDPYSLPGREVKDILVDEKGRIWVATEGGLGLYNPEKENFERYRYTYDDKSTLSNNNVLALAEGRDNEIWVGTRNGLNKLNPEKKSFIRYYSDSNGGNFLSSNIIQSILVDREENVWLGTPSGLTRVYPDITRSAIYRYGDNEINSLPNDFILSLMADESGMIWIGTQSAGIATLNLEVPKFNSVTFPVKMGFEPERNRVNGFCGNEDSGIWVASGEGIYLFNPNTGQSVFSLPGENHPINISGYSATDIETCGDSLLWVATEENGLWCYRMDSDDLTLFSVDSEILSGISSNQINDLLIDSDGNLWIGTSGGGLNYYDAELDEFRVYRFDGSDPNSIRDNNIISLAQDSNGSIWLGTGNAGAYVLDPNTETFIKHFHTDSSSQPLLHNTVNDIFMDEEGFVWMGTDNGLVRYDPGSDSTNFYLLEDGLVNDVVLSITADQYGILWLSTNAGLSAFEKKTNTFRNYTEQVVLGRNVFTKDCCLSTEGGLIFFGGTNGFDYFNSVGFSENNYRPRIAITGIELFPESGVDSLIQELKVIGDSVWVDKNYAGISIAFASLSYKQPEKNRYAYRISGVVNDWRFLGERRYVSFSSLTPGVYEFEVKGSNNDGVWSEKPAKLTVIVEAAFWETSAFRIFAVLVVLALLFLFNRYLVASEKARRKALEMAVQERTEDIARERDTNAILLREVHHRVKNNLQVIVSLLNLQTIYIKDPKLLTTLSEIQNRVRSMSLIHQKMYKTENLSTINLREYIEDLAQNLLETYRIKHSVQLDVNVTVEKFHSDTLTPLGLFINEVISNSLKHAFRDDMKGKITVELHAIKDHKFSLVIGDNGRGMPSESGSKRESFGTELISALSEQLNGTMEVESSESGTRYRLIFEDVGS